MQALTPALFRGARKSGSVDVDFEALELRGDGLVAGDAEEARGLALHAVGFGQGAAEVVAGN
jgi:hypothetical protein